MSDKLKLNDTDIPIQKRYDDFVLWTSQNHFIISDSVAEEIGVHVSVVEVFYELGCFEPEEFAIIDREKIDVGSLFIIVRCSRRVRQKIYENYRALSSNPRRLEAIRNFADEQNLPDFNSVIQRVSGEAWYVIAKYLKDRNIDSGSLNKGLRSMAFNAARRQKNGQEITVPMCDWIVRAIAQDKARDLKVFSNDILKNEHPDDYALFQELLANVDTIEPEE